MDIAILICIGSAALLSVGWLTYAARKSGNTPLVTLFGVAVAAAAGLCLNGISTAQGLDGLGYLAALIVAVAPAGAGFIGGLIAGSLAR